MDFLAGSSDCKFVKTGKKSCRLEYIIAVLVELRNQVQISSSFRNTKITLSYHFHLIISNIFFFIWRDASFFLIHRCSTTYVLVLFQQSWTFKAAVARH